MALIHPNERQRARQSPYGTKAPRRSQDLAIYVHWPFCLSKCPYCDFNSHVRTQPVDEERYLDAYLVEIAHRANLTQGRTVASIFFGGGTPSLMKAQTVGAILDAIAAHWAMAANAEITLEANPTSVEATRFAGYKMAGVNRVSLGVQALNDADLLALGRQHSAAEALAAVEIAAKTFERFSFDLIYARSNQSLKDWQKELKNALLRTKDHLSLYQLTLEQGTIFEKLAAKGVLSLPDEDLGRAFWDLTQEIMECAGLPAYEVSNHARQGAESRHNLIYWRYGEYAGIGPGAHGRILTAETRLAQATEKHPDLWLNRVETLGHGLIEDEALDAAQQGDEFLLMGLRLAEGIDLARFEAIAGKPINPQAIASLVEENLVEYSGAGRLRVSEKGFPLLNSVIAYLAV